jgi:c-di-GMP-binding flagellar brake protein YcgR
MAKPENLLFRSRIEIARIMQVLVRKRSAVAADVKNGHPFHSRIIAFDPATERFAVAYGPHKQINAMVLDSARVEFTATENPDLYFSFEGTAPEETKIDGEPAIQFTMPGMLYLHNRREHPRTAVSADVSLRCVADESGFIPFESHVTDISHDGMGCLIYDPGVNLEAGTILKGCRIITRDGDAVIADLELRHIGMVALADGSQVCRAGFRFAHKTTEQDKLIGVFIKDLDKQ